MSIPDQRPDPVLDLLHMAKPDGTVWAGCEITLALAFDRGWVEPGVRYLDGHGVVHRPYRLTDAGRAKARETSSVIWRDL